jgi:hypothetical protein
MWFTRMIACFMVLTLTFMIFGPSDIYIWIARALFTWLAYLLYRRVQLQRAARRENNSVPAPPEDNTTIAGAELLEEGNNGNH